MNNKHLRDIFTAALAAADPYHAVKRALRIRKNRLYAGGAAYSLDGFSSIIVVGAGKATARMAKAVEDTLGERITKGIVIVKHGHTAPLRIIEQVEASHPTPDEAGEQAGRRILELVKAADESTLIICLLSGGGSALLVAPANGITLADKQETTRLLLMAGADIDELNAVRKHLSAVKGGRLAEAAAPAPLLTFILSDVIGDRLDVIASGPTAPDRSTYQDALSVIRKYGLESKIPANVLARLKRGEQSLIPETVKSGDPCLARTRNVIVAGIRQALAAAQDRARQLGYSAEVVTAELHGEARHAAGTLARAALTVRDVTMPGERRCLLFGGETTVTVRGNGKGGRNQELALAFAIEIAGKDGIVMLAAGTDGTDGPTDAAGAVVDGQTVPLAQQQGLDPAAFLADNDSYTFFQKYDELTGGTSHLKTGPTGTNVMDVQIILIEGA